ncbi:hypothetical protein [Microcoleus sp. B3-D7]|uniref:hypothetical protein n=1 Tax=Microcoleus sp. B3-D7 TaxID=2818659 RepID=UPI002FD3F2FD
MQLVERQVIKPNHRFYPEADRLSLLSNKLYNCNNYYIYGQNFFSGQLTNSLGVVRSLKKSLNYKALPAQVTHKTLPLLLKTWTSYHSVKLAGAIAIAPLSFKQHRKSLIKKIRKKESRGDMYLYLTVNVLAKKLFPKNMSFCLGLTFGGLEKLPKSWKSGLFPR